MGIYVDENLNWKEHVNFLNLSALYQRPDSTFPCPRCVPYIFALVYPYLQYATTVWGSTYKTTLNRPYCVAETYQKSKH